MTAPRETALIFDLDNTLIHSTIDFLGVRHRLIDLLESRGAAAPAPREALLRRAIPELVAIGEAASPDLGEAMWDEVARAERLGLQHAAADEHAIEVLRTLRSRGYRLAVLTNNAREGVVAKLAEVDLARYFDVIATRDDVAALKPSPEGLRYILARLPGVRAAFVIGDAWIDALAARDAGLPFIGVGPKRLVALERGAQPWTWLDRLRDLLDLDLTRGA